MINNFETYTQPLSDEERKVIVPAMVTELRSHKGARNAIKNQAIAEKVFYLCNIKPNDARVRKCINYIRTSGLVPCLISTSDGYYVATGREEVKKCIDSLFQRSVQIENVAKALTHQMNQVFNPEPKLFD